MTTEKQSTTRDIDWGKLIETALTAPGSVGNTYNRFYNYSFMNQMLLLSQGVLEPVATYQRWKAIGRQVLRGSKAKEIIRPITVTLKDQLDDQGEPKKLTKFKPVKCLFTVSETEGDELPPVETPDWKLPVALEALDIRQVPFQLLDGNTQGYSIGREFALNPVATDPTGTTFHEIGHIVLGHTEPAKVAEYGTHRGVMEFQAEATSYLSMHELDVLTEQQASESRGYIQGWLRRERPADVAIRQVFSATDRILRAGRSAES
jgi:hypothetical protein